MPEAINRQTSTSMTDALNGGNKHRAACDQCRQRKLKCSGEPAGCTRCIREGVVCHYSLQKPMGRPRKRRRENGDDTNEVPEDNYLDDLLPTLDLALDGAIFPDFPKDRIFSNGTNDDLTVGFDFTINELSPELFDPTSFEAKELPINQMQAPLLLTDNISHFDESSQPTPPSPDPSRKCFCLSTMFLATSELQKESPPGMGFPFILGPLKSAINKVDDILNCDVCPCEMATLRENTLLVITLLNSIVATFHKLLRVVDDEAVDLTRNGQRKHLRMGAPATPENFHLHTGTPDCPMGVNIDLDPSEWRTLSFRAAKNEIWERGLGNLTLESMLSRLVARQEAWHVASGSSHKGNACACIHMTSTIRRALEELPE